MSEGSINPHGGDIYKASELYGIKSEDFLDFSANINPLGVPEKLKDIIIKNISSLVNYPDPDCKEIGYRISRYLDMPEDNIIIGNGASEIIFLLFDMLKPRNVLMPAPTFSEYAKAAHRYGAEVTYFQLEEQEDFKLNIDRLILEIRAGIDAVVLCNPNNPTSTLVKKGELLRLASHAREKGVAVIIDEAFIELTRGANDNSIVQHVREFDNLFIVRAFTKLFAIPGLRLGYGIGSPGLIGKMWDYKMPWSVNTFACCTGEFLGKAEDYMKETSRWIDEEIEWFYNELRKLERVKVFEPNTNFVLVKILKDDLTSAVLRDIMASKAVLIRDASNFKFLNDKFFRLAVKDRKSNMELLRILRDVLIH